MSTDPRQQSDDDEGCAAVLRDLYGDRWRARAMRSTASLRKADSAFGAIDSAIAKVDGIMPGLADGKADELFEKVKSLRELAESFNKKSGAVMEEGRRTLLDISQAAVKVDPQIRPAGRQRREPARRRGTRARSGNDFTHCSLPDLDIAFRFAEPGLAAKRSRSFAAIQTAQSPLNRQNSSGSGEPKFPYGISFSAGLGQWNLNICNGSSISLDLKSAALFDGAKADSHAHESGRAFARGIP